MRPQKPREDGAGEAVGGRAWAPAVACKHFLQPDDMGFMARVCREMCYPVYALLASPGGEAATYSNSDRVK